MSTRLPAPAFENKITTMEELNARAQALPHPVVMTNGVFDILHRGHVTYLAQARALGASLVVAINSRGEYIRCAVWDGLLLFVYHVFRNIDTGTICTDRN